MTPRDPAQDALALQRLFAEVEAAPWAHDFFALLRRIEGLTPHLPRLGQAARPSQEALRLGQEPELDFAPAALASLSRGEHAVAPRLGVRFFGLLGPQGPMPLHLTEYARERLHQRGDRTMSRFLDIFHHRLLLLFYRAWAQSQPAVQLDRPHDDRYGAWLGAAVGLDGDLRPHDSLKQSDRLFHAGLMGGNARHPEGLEKILTQQFSVPVRIEQHVGHWLELEDEDRTQLGYARNRSERIGRPRPRLGRNATLGWKAWDRQFRFRVVLGPMSWSSYQDFLPDGRHWRSLNHWVREYVGDGLWWDVRPLLLEQDIPDGRLGRGARLGYTAWVGSAGSATSGGAGGLGQRHPPSDFDPARDRPAPVGDSGPRAPSLTDRNRLRLHPGHLRHRPHVPAPSVDGAPSPRSTPASPNDPIRTRPTQGAPRPPGSPS